MTFEAYCIRCNWLTVHRKAGVKQYKKYGFWHTGQCQKCDRIRVMRKAAA